MSPVPAAPGTMDRVLGEMNSLIDEHDRFVISRGSYSGTLGVRNTVLEQFNRDNTPDVKPREKIKRWPSRRK
jgi:hypothetical protein